ncbi:inositol hexakisphosphate kinase 3-like [Frankliniella occidentalis]|uniref:Kinase n=1 Tax=Frankliniella occidentalis TaxID=133901 RepID=A0A6J1SL88_FRAOC|nr:inositol hexakisphosphate kinase 3-like [Frankliniella occidentalis]
MADVPKASCIRLEPFIHQVGGHSSMLCLDEATVCKPLVKRELQFYETLPEAVSKFTPHFYGVIQVNVQTEEEDYVTLNATPPKFYKPISSSPTQRVRLRRTGSIEVNQDDHILFEEDSLDGETQPNNTSLALNPWVLKCHRDHLSAIINTATTQNFILLENVASQFTFPCILDLKMGTRQYGDADTLAKKQSKMVKVVSTTSAKLGVRVGGMQVYQTTTGRFLCRNKLYGRSLSVNGFSQALCKFLHNGKRIRNDVLPPLIKRLEELLEVLHRQEAVRFYTASLLLLYEGQDQFDSTECKGREENVPRKASISHFKFEEAIETKYDSPSKSSSSGPGNNNISPSAQDMESIVNAFEEERQRSERMRHRRSSSCVALNDILAGSSNLSLPSSPSPLQASVPTEPTVDVRIIDFAHSTHQGLADPVSYTGPDSGFIFGLENMISILKNIERDNG